MSSVHVAAAAFVALLPITNPPGAVAVFAALTGGQTPAETRRTAVRTGLYVGAILVVFALLGSLLLSALGITVPALQIAGGLVVAHSGFRLGPSGIGALTRVLGFLILAIGVELVIHGIQALVR